MQIDSSDCISKEPIQLWFRISTSDMRIHEAVVLKTEIDKHVYVVGCQIHTNSPW